MMARHRERAQADKGNVENAPTQFLKLIDDRMQFGMVVANNRRRCIAYSLNYNILYVFKPVVLIVWYCSTPHVREIFLERRVAPRARSNSRSKQIAEKIECLGFRDREHIRDVLSTILAFSHWLILACTVFNTPLS